MWFIILLVIIVVIAVVVKKFSDKAKQERLEQEKMERQKRVAAEAKSQKHKYEKITEFEKEQLSKIGDETLNATLNAFNKAISGDATAMTFIGYTYRLQLKDSVKSAYWIQKAANAGNLDAKYWLGKYYMHGYGVTENRVKGTSIIIAAAQKGNKLAIESLAEDFHMSKEEMRSNGIPV